MNSDYVTVSYQFFSCRGSSSWYWGSEVDCVFSVTDRPTRPGSDGPCPAGRVRPTDPVLTRRAQRGENFWGRTRPTDRPSQQLGPPRPLVGRVRPTDPLYWNYTVGIPETNMMGER